MTNDTVVVFASFHPLPGKAGELQDLLSWMVERTRAEQGCERYDLYRRGGEEEGFHLFERYRDQEALEEHRAAAYYIVYRRRVTELIDGAVDVVLLEPVDVAGESSPG